MSSQLSEIEKLAKYMEGAPGDNSLIYLIAKSILELDNKIDSINYSLIVRDES